MSLGDTIKNKAEKLGGKGKEVAGDLTGNEDLKAEGQADQISGTIKEGLNKVGEKLQNVADTVTAKVDAASNKIKEETSNDPAA
ncbi:MAG: CsbD family protein [Corynebacterium sp.]|nr:CsbD family protein [Corynebacterium sp.]